MVPDFLRVAVFIVGLGFYLVAIHFTLLFVFAVVAGALGIG